MFKLRTVGNNGVVCSRQARPRLTELRTKFIYTRPDLVILGMAQPKPLTISRLVCGGSVQLDGSKTLHRCSEVEARWKKVGEMGTKALQREVFSCQSMEEYESKFKVRPVQG